jgi:DNA polymerase
LQAASLLSGGNVKVLHIDFETRSACDIKKAGADVYARHPSTSVLCMAWAIDDGPVELWTPNKSNPYFNSLLKDREIWAHNAPFEIAIWNHVCTRLYGWPKVTADQFHCTMAMAYAMALPGSLERAAAAAGIAHQKDMQGSRIMMQLAQPRDTRGDGSVVWWEEKDVPEKFERLYAYCKQDIEVERELGKRLRKLSDFERRVWLLDHKINQRGVAVDLPAVRRAIDLVEGEKDRLDAEMREATSNQVGTCTANGQLLDFLKWRGIKAESVDKSTVVSLLEKEIPDDCRKALLLRQEAAKSSTAKLESMVRGTCNDGRSRGLFQYHGAATGRWAGRRIQLQNLPRPKISQEDIEEVFELLVGP